MEGGHKISTRRKTGFSLQNQITKAISFFSLPFPQVQRIESSPAVSPFSSLLPRPPDLQPLPRPSGSDHNVPQMQNREASAPMGGAGQGITAQVHPLQASAFSSAPFLFSHLSLSFSHIPSLPRQPILSPAASPPVPCFSAFLAIHSLPG